MVGKAGATLIAHQPMGFVEKHPAEKALLYATCLPKIYRRTPHCQLIP